MQKRIPMRMCTGCNEMKPKKELIRVLRTPEGEILIDSTNKKAGRGAYICKNIDCFKKSRKSKRMERAFDCSIPEDIITLLEEEVSNL